MEKRNDGTRALTTAGEVHIALRKAVAEAQQCFDAEDDQLAVEAVTKLHHLSYEWLVAMADLGRVAVASE